VFGWADGFRGGRAAVELDGVAVPRSSLLGEPGRGFPLMQALLGPARLHHCMRLVGVAERALGLLCARAVDRRAFGEALADKGTVQDWIAGSRIRIEHLRALVAHGAALVDAGDARGASTTVAVLKAAAPTSVEWVVDKAIQVHGADGFSHGTPLAMLWAYARTLRVSDGPDEVHRRTVALRELQPYRRG
jgi:acyl-CoA dehydrogenase